MGGKNQKYKKGYFIKNLFSTSFFNQSFSNFYRRSNIKFLKYLMQEFSKFQKLN